MTHHLTRLHTGKYVLALRSLKAAAAIDPESPRLHSQTVALRHALNQEKELPAKVQEVLKEEFDLIEPSTDLKKYNQDFQAKHKASPRHVLAAIRVKRVLGEDRSKCDKEVTSLLDNSSIDFTIAIEALETLKRWKSPEEAEFKKAAQAKWPEVTRLA